ncbi:MAG: hypothetical protein OI74_01140 [Gammaproteobacteria bacterium (ex Lamellibrachia satsuma)]|nr:MAG: metal-dependent hydrolase [Gammaproteobacteria bacterium (ex Lamellibrachia satsuma)]RRS35988.1 MAG: hypothetical protein OI74_01140 [Gammaproteobacteria bacterium (ex Lamellibrachia satsuma)]RRS36580.1 MAG: hypothetical protein NV67_06810 [Gammaproteobacteria bacterium (ex Lamellibrachia satsuma)]
MDTITHTLVGVLAIQTGLLKPLALSLPSRARLLTVTCLAAAFPDIDYVGILFDPLSFITDWHRGPTHSFLMLPVWALLLGWLFAAFGGQLQHRGLYTAIAAIALTSHILTDIITPWGTQIFWPLSDYRAVLATTFVIDPLFTGIVVMGLASKVYCRSERFARLGVAVMILYLGLQGLLQHQAYQIAKTYSTQEGFREAKITVLPQPFSPAHWKLIVNESDRYHIAYADLFSFDLMVDVNERAGVLSRLVAAYRPLTQLVWQQETRYGDEPNIQALVRQAWAQEEFSRYRRFAQIPLLYGVSQEEERFCAWFADSRYMLPLIPPPFRYGMCRMAGGEWQVVRQVPDV